MILTDSDNEDILELDPQAPIDPMRASLAYLLAAHDEAEAKNLRAMHRDSLKEWIIANGEPDENGNLRFYFDSPITLFDPPVSGLMAQRRTSEFVNEDIALEVAEKYGVLDQVLIETVSYELDLDKLYALNQQGIIPDEDIDSVFEIVQTYALTKIQDDNEQASG